MFKFSRLFLIGFLCFILIPFVFIFIRSFFTNELEFTLHNYQLFFTPLYLKLTLDSFIYAFIITLITLIISFPLAYLISLAKHKNLLLIFIIIPSWINLILKAYAFLALVGSNGPLNNFLASINLPPFILTYNLAGFIISAVYISLPFMVLPLYRGLQEIPLSTINAARDLGANFWQVIYKIVIPLTRNHLNSAIQLVFIPSLSLFVLSRLITGNKVITLGTAIEQNFLVSQNWGFGSTIASMLIIFFLLFFLVVNFLVKQTKGGTNE